jgi:hypothetical protein
MGRFVVLVFSIALAASTQLVGATSVSAASTRGEYIAQVDPICVTFVGPENDAAKAFIKNAKRLGRVGNSGHAKAFVRQLRRTAGSLSRLGRVDLALNNQIAAVPPPAADAPTIGAWLDGRREADGLLESAASALGQFKPRLYLKRFKRAFAVNDAANELVSGFGFQVCGVTV